MTPGANLHVTVPLRQGKEDDDGARYFPLVFRVSKLANRSLHNPCNTANFHIWLRYIQKLTSMLIYTIGKLLKRGASWGVV